MNVPAPSSGPPIVQYWHSAEAPPEVAQLLATFPPANPDMPHLVFDEAGAEEMIEKHLGARHADAFRACAVPAMQADYFRYCAVYALGGVYADADFSCARPLRPLVEVEGQLFELDPPRGPALNNLFAFRAPRHPFLALAIEVATRNVERRISDNVALTTGPAIFSGLLQLHRGEPLEDLRGLIRPAWRAELEACWEELVASLMGTIADVGPLETALAGVRISSRAEMLTWVNRTETELSYKRKDDYWANWKGSIFRTSDGGNVR
jgi:hypothetical protein